MTMCRRAGRHAVTLRCADLLSTILLLCACLGDASLPSFESPWASWAAAAARWQRARQQLPREATLHMQLQPGTTGSVSTQCKPSATAPRGRASCVPQGEVRTASPMVHHRGGVMQRSAHEQCACSSGLSVHPDAGNAADPARATRCTRVRPCGHLAMWLDPTLSTDAPPPNPPTPRGFAITRTRDLPFAVLLGGVMS